MAATPEIARNEPQMVERQEEFVVDETLKNSGAQVVQKNFKAQVKDDNGKPLIQTPPTQIISVTPPADETTLTSWSKGSTSSSTTWLGKFWLRIIKKAMFFGWKIIGFGPKDSGN